VTNLSDYRRLAKAARTAALPEPVGEEPGSVDVALDARTVEILEQRRAYRSVVRTRGWLVRRALLAADVTGLALAFFVAQVVYGPTHPSHDQLSPGLEYLVFALTIPLWVVAAHLAGLYDRDGERTDHSGVDDLMRVFNVVTAGTWLFFLFAWLTELVNPDPPRTAVFWGLAIVLVVLGRALVRAMVKRSTIYLQNTIVVGAGEIGQLIARKILKHPEYGINLVGFVDSEPREQRGDLDHLTLLGPPEKLPDLVKQFDVDRVVIAFSKDGHEPLLELVRALKSLGIQVDLVPRLFEIVGPRVDVHTVEGLPLVGLPPVQLSALSRRLKRLLDLVVATAMLVLTAPLFAYISFRIRRESAGGVFFRQTRLGKNMSEFTVLKFRTMYVQTSADAHREHIRSIMSSRAPAGPNGLYKLDQSDSITPFGRWLRKTSLDELPQLINVVRGEMSLVGPRPCIPYEVENFAPYQFDRFLVPAGITGLWQVTARAHSSFGEALDMDVAYARGWSFGLDLRLLCLTPLALMAQKATL
jgi:exopolysaccharide biosynthesis polyprenyl glycosylphosphotransferase